MTISATTGLVSLDQAKMHLHITTTTDDRLLEEIVMSASIMIQKELGYLVRSQSYTEYHSGQGALNLWLVNRPVTSVQRCSIGYDDACNVVYSGTAARATGKD